MMVLVYFSDSNIGMVICYFQPIPFHSNTEPLDGRGAATGMKVKKMQGYSKTNILLEYYYMGWTTIVVI